MAELTVHFCEEAVAFANAYGLDDESFYDSLVRMLSRQSPMPWRCPRQARNHFSNGSAK